MGKKKKVKFQGLLMAPLWKGPWIMSIRTPKPTLTQYQIFLLHWQCDVFTDLLTTVYSLSPDLGLWTFSWVVRGGRGTHHADGQRTTAGSPGSVDSTPKAPQELLGTCEGPSCIT